MHTYVGRYGYVCVCRCMSVTVYTCTNVNMGYEGCRYVWAYGCVDVCLYPGLSAQVYVCILGCVYEGYVFQCLYVHMCIGSAVKCVVACPYLDVSAQWCVCVYMYMCKCWTCRWVCGCMSISSCIRCKKYICVCVWRACVCLVVVCG